MKNWKSTLSALLGAIWIAIQPIMDKGDLEIERDWKQLLTAAGLAVFGFLVKDADLTSNKGESHNIPQDEKTTTVAGQDTSERETSRPQIFEDNDGTLTVITEPRSTADNITDTRGEGRSVEAGTGSPAENI